VAAAILLVPLAALALRCSVSRELPYLPARPDAPWVVAPAPVSAELQQWGETQVPVTRFTRRFRATSRDAAARLELCALGEARVVLNGAELARLPRRGLRGRAHGSVEIGGALRPGQNELRVEIANATGPAALSLRSEGLEEVVRSGPSWSVSQGERVYARAAPADDTRINPRSLALETPAEALRQKGDALLALCVLGAVGSWWLQRAPGDRTERALAWAAPLLGSAAWLWLGVAKVVHIPAAIGFDARHHLLYVDRLLSGTLPLATDGWSTYHPPLFHALAAALVAAGGGEAGLKALPMLAGIGTLWMAWLLARRLFPEAPRLSALAALFAATLPVHLYSASYFSNEALHACLASAALVVATECLLAQRVRLAKLALAALLFGLAALSKFTVLATVPVALGFLFWKLALVERAGRARTAGALAVFAGVFLLVAGWFYARSWLHYGTPVVGNWALPGADQRWWQQPGFHTAAYYLRFGEALRHPYLAGFHSFWDSLYSTFWGDGFVAGRTDPYQRHTFWDYGFMSAGYWLALPASVLLLAGGVRLLREALGRGPAHRRLALGWLATAGYAVGFAFLSLTLALPFFAQAKAAYLLMLTGPLALAFAAGFDALDARLGRAPRALLHGWLTACAGAFFLAFAA